MIFKQCVEGYNKSDGFFLEHAFQEEKYQSQNSKQHFESFRSFLGTGRPAILPAGQLLFYCQCWKKCGKIQNVVSSFDFEIFSPEIHTLALLESLQISNLFDREFRERS